LVYFSLAKKIKHFVFKLSKKAKYKAIFQVQPLKMIYLYAFKMI